jgi:hypothetical protein
LRWIKTLLVVNRIDAIIVFAAVWTLVAAYIYGGGDWYSQDIWSLLLFCSSWAIGAAAGCKQICWYRTAVLVICQIFFCWLVRSNFEVQIGLGVRNPIPENPLKDTTTQLFQWLVVGLVSFGLHFGVRLSLEWCTKKMSGKEPEGSSRFEVLMYVTVLLWFTHWIVTNNSSVMNELGRKSLPNLLGISLVSYVLAHCLTGRWSWIFACVVFPALGLVFFFRSSYELYFFWLVVAAVLLIAALIAVGSGVSRRQATGSDPTPAMTNRCPSVWGVLPAAILLLFNISPNWMNLPTLFSELGSDLQTRWYYAKANGDVLRSLDGVGCWDERQMTIVLDFADATRNDRLELTSNRIAAGELSFVPGTSIRLHNMHPEVATPAWSGVVSVHKGRLTTEQLVNLASSGSYLGIEDVSLIADKPISMNLRALSLYFLKTSPSKLRAFLDTLGADCKLSYLGFHFPITEDYWPIVLEAGKQHSIWQLDMSPDDFLAMVTSSPETKLKLHHGHQFSIRELAEFPQVFETSLPGLMVSLDDVSPLSPLEAVLLVRNFRLTPGDVDWWSETPDWDTENLLTFERFESGKAKSVFLPAFPTTAFKAQGLEFLETLSIDSNWLKSNGSSIYDPAFSREFDASLFENTIRLRRLYLPWNCPSFDQTPLTGLKDLKELQVPWHVFDVEQNLEKFPKLEKLTLFAINYGVPGISRRLNLPNLKKLDIVIWDRMMALQQLDIKSVKANLQAALPGVEISIIMAHDFQPKIPANFQSHLEKVTVRLLKKLEEASVPRE